MDLLILAILICYMLAIIAVAIVGGGYRSKRAVDFLLSGKTLGPIVLSFSYTITYFSSAAFLGGGGMGFLVGFQWSTFLFFFHVLFAVLSWVLIAPRLKRFTDNSRSLTVSEFLGTRFSSRALQVISALIFIVFMEFYMISIFKGAGSIIQVILGVPYVQALLIIAVPAVIYASIGGFKGNVMVGLLQGVIMIASAVVLFGATIAASGGWEGAIARLSGMTLGNGIAGSFLTQFPGPASSAVSNAGATLAYVLSLTFAISFAQMTSPHMVVQFYSAKSEKVLRFGKGLAPLLICVFAFAVFFLGPFGWLIINDPASLTMAMGNPDLVIPFMAVSLFGSTLGSFLLIAILAAAMSTLAPVCIMLSGAFTRDVLSSFNIKASEGRSVTLLRAFTIAFGVVPLILAINPPDVIVGIVGVAFSVLSSAFFAPIIAGLYLKRVSRSAALASIISASVVCIVWHFVFYSTYFIYPIVPGLVAGVLAYVIFSLRGVKLGNRDVE